MARHRFHCTNGLECVFDRRGREVAPGEPILRQARHVAERLMRRPGAEDWSAWSVTVHDLDGRQVLVLPFRAARTPAVHGVRLPRPRTTRPRTAPSWW
ncbi:MAG: hypothetical protein PGN34_15020 [Methylobacterium frigidaeris]